MSDIVFSTLTLWILLKEPAGNQQDAFMLGVLVAMLCICYLTVSHSHYSVRRPYWDEFGNILTTLFWGCCAHISLTLLIRSSTDAINIACAWVATFFAILLSRFLFRQLRKLTNTWYSPYILIGKGENSLAAEAALADEPNLGYRCVEQLSAFEASNFTTNWLENHPNVTWVIALEHHEQLQLQHIVAQLDLHAADFIVIPPTRGLPLFGMQSFHIFTQDVLLLRGQNRLSQLPTLLFKRAVDLLGSISLLVLLSPALLVIAAIVKADGGALLFWHQRVGLHGRLFMCPKFRSMRPNAAAYLDDLLANNVDLRNEWEAQYKLRHDPRVTPLGKWLRALSIDELPQLWSVLRGDMSLVGPRPITQDELLKYGKAARYFTQVRPGITGLWQVSGRSETDYETRVALDTWYVRNWSFGLDMIILLKTVGVLIRRRGAW